jgi:hypothetical protein
MTTPKPVAHTVWPSAAAALALICAVPAQHDLTAAFPATTWACVRLAGLDQQTEVFRDASIVALLRQVLGEEGRDRLQALAREQGSRQLHHAHDAFARLGVDPRHVRGFLAGGVALGVGRPAMMGNAMLPSVALVTVPADTESAGAVATAAERMLLQRAGATVSEQDVAGTRFVRLDLPHGHGQLLHGIHRGHFLLGNSAGYLADCIAAISGQCRTLAQNESLGRSRSRVHGEEMAALFVNAKQFGATLAPLMPYGPRPSARLWA